MFMVEYTGPANPENEARRADTLINSDLPQEPFPCPSCGQMLAPTVRVCVACKQTIDPAQITRAQAGPGPFETHGTQPATARVQFPWPLFFVLLAVRLLAAVIAQRHWGLVKAELALGSLELLTGAWVFFDAQQRGVPKPLRWGIGSLFLWILVFPWYLVRRKTPQASCPFVEAEVGPVTRALFIILIVLFLLGAADLILKGPPAR